MTSPRIFALALAVALCAPAAVRAQAPSDSDGEADSALVIIARADSARAALVQPPGSRGPSLAHFVRLPFHLFGAGVALAAGVVYLPYQLVQETGLLDRGVYDTVAFGGAHDIATRYLAPTVLSGVKPDAAVMDE